MAVLTDFRTYLEAYYDEYATSVDTNQKQAEIKEETLRKLHSLDTQFILAGRDASYDAALAYYQEMLTLLAVPITDDAWDVTTANLATFFGTSTAVTIPQDYTLDWDAANNRYAPYSAKQTGGEFYFGGETPSAETMLNFNGIVTSTRRGLPAVAAPSVSIEGQEWNDSTQKCMVVYIDGLKQYTDRVIFAQTANKTIGNTTSETSLIGTGIGTLTLPANFWTVGKTLMINIRGFMSGVNGNAATIRIKLGSVTLVTSVSNMPATFTNTYFDAEYCITCQSTGITGTVIGQGKTNIAAGVGLATSYTRPLVMTSAAVINTTTSALLDCTYQWGTAAVGNTLTTTNNGVRIWA